MGNAQAAKQDLEYLPKDEDYLIVLKDALAAWPKKISLTGIMRELRDKGFKVSEWTARIFQHEIDNLDGVLYTDLATKVWKPSAEEEELIKD